MVLMSMFHARHPDPFEAEYDDALNETVAVMSNWFELWTVAATHHPAAGFLHDALPFFLVWKAVFHFSQQGYVLNHQEPDQRLKRIMMWYRQIRVFLDTHAEITPELWETLPTEGLERRDGTIEKQVADGYFSHPGTADFRGVSRDEDLESLVAQVMSFKLDA
jgi:hypothetical protein